MLSRKSIHFRSHFYQQLHVMASSYTFAGFWDQRRFLSFFVDMKLKFLGSSHFDLIRVDHLDHSYWMLSPLSVSIPSLNIYEFDTKQLHSGRIPWIGWQNPFGHSLILKLFWTFWLLLDIEWSFIHVRTRFICSNWPIIWKNCSELRCNLKKNEEKWL